MDLASNSTEQKIYKRGEIYYIDDSGDNNGSVQAYSRPVLLISNDIGNLHSSILICVPITSKDKKPLPTHVTITNSSYSGNAKLTGTVLCEQILTFDKSCVIGECVCKLNDRVMTEIDKALCVSLSINCDIKMNPIMMKYYDELEKQIKEHNFEYNHNDYLVKNKIVKVPVIEKDSDYIELMKELIMYKTQAETYKTLFEQMFSKMMNN